MRFSAMRSMYKASSWARVSLHQSYSFLALTHILGGPAVKDQHLLECLGATFFASGLGGVVDDIVFRCHHVLCLDDGK